MSKRWSGNFSLKRMAHFHFALLALLAALLSGCASNGRDSKRTVSSEPQPYMRITRPESNIVTLEIALRKFAPPRGRGPVIWLSGVSHIGETNYYSALQRHLEGQALVLFEGVGARDKRMRFDPKEEISIQHTMASALGLVFQLAVIDYDRPQFRNSDLTIPQLQRLLAGQAAGDPEGGTGTGRTTGGNREFQELLGVMDGSSFLGTLLHAGLKLIGTSPKLRAVTKIVMIETLGQLTADMSAIRGMPPEIQRLLEVIIRERNKVVVDDLRKELATRPTPNSISVFYGAGHMADLEKRLRTELGYRPSGEQWLRAITVDLRETGLSSLELEAMRGMIQWQLDALKGE